MSNRERSPAYQDGIVVGNIEDRENPANPLSKFLIRRFDETLFRLLSAANSKSLHEVGCGEGRLTRAIATRFEIPIRASDFGKHLIRELQSGGPDNVSFVPRSIYDLNPQEDRADTIVCCEVLEHLERPAEAIMVLRNLAASSYIFSVPREPIWRFMNVCRGRYLLALGNTPGHINHWSKRAFLRFLRDNGFNSRIITSPLPWTMGPGRIWHAGMRLFGA